VTAVTAQNSVEVADWVAIAPEMVVLQMETVARDMKVAAAKTGMLAEAAIVAAVADAARRLALPHLVVDPVMIAKGGHRLLRPEAERAYRERLLPLASVVTPNLPEAEALLGRDIRTLEDMRAAARALLACGARAVVVKGGHLLEGDAVDVYDDGTTAFEMRAPRIDTPHTHGTGCTFSAAIAARLALGDALPDAVRAAKAYVTEAIRGGYAVGRGHGALDHLHPLRAVR
jgi:hydroxymethylpyrimidine/phosphomethylpyrimidine kinase